MEDKPEKLSDSVESPEAILQALKRFLKKVYKKIIIKSQKNQAASREFSLNLNKYLKPFLYRLRPFWNYTGGGYNIQLIPMKIPFLHFHQR